MNISLATNYRTDLILGLKGLPVKELFGSLPYYGSARSSLFSGYISKKAFVKHVRLAKARGISFNYLLNTSVTMLSEFSISGIKQLHKLLVFLRDTGVNRITVTNHFYLQYIKKFFPEFRVIVSSFAFVDSIQKALLWKEQGADAIVIASYFVNREIQFLKKLRDALPNIELIIMVNNNCITGCSMAEYHANTDSTASLSINPYHAFYLPLSYYICTLKKLREPEFFIRSEWIRPEDLYLYEDIGYSNFKIVQRNMPTKTLLNRATAYANRRYNGNLLDLISTFDSLEFRDLDTIGRLAFLRSKIKWSFYEARKYFSSVGLRIYKYPALIKRMKRNKELIEEIRDVFSDGSIYIDNNKLLGFGSHFVNLACREMDCTKCGYCSYVAKHSIKMTKRVEHLIDKLEIEINDIISGRLL